LVIPSGADLGSPRRQSAEPFNLPQNPPAPPPDAHALLAAGTVAIALLLEASRRARRTLQGVLILS
jgi:hypothetical protein